MKKFLFLAALFVSQLTSAQVAQYDANNNEKANVGDIVTVINILKTSGTSDVNRDGSTDIADVSSLKHYLLYNANGCDFVDLGLPSGTLWATCNVGATKPEQYGLYLAWGEIAAKTTNNYDWSTYGLCYGTSTSLKAYNNDSAFGTVDNKTTLESSNDAAVQTWKGTWGMPTNTEIAELRNTSYCAWTSTTINDINGYLVTSKTNGNSIFLPFGGYQSGSTVSQRGSTGYYWSSTLNESTPTTAYCMVIDNSNFTHCNIRAWGRSVRPVIHGNKN